MASAAVMHDHSRSLHTSALELKYERSNHLVDMIVKDETVRKMRFDKHVLEDDNAELRDLLLNEQERSVKLEDLMNDHLGRAEAAEAALQTLEQTAQLRDQELSSLQAERDTLKNLSTDTNKLVTERLELSHELSRLRPELEHLRGQVTANESLLTEKLNLQRKVSELEVELENAKRDAQRALAKRRNTMHEVAQEDELETVRKSLAKEKRLHERAKETIEELQSENKQLKKSSQREIATETSNAEHSAEIEVRTQELVRDLAKEQKEKSRAERALTSAQTEWETTKAVLDDKLTQYKNRVRNLKDRLKETEASLETAQAAAAAVEAAPTKSTAAAPASRSVTIAAPPAAKQAKGRKRAAGALDPDATALGTPGDAPSKRVRRGANVGEKSSFSITPFLNRTMNMGGEGSDDEAPSADEATPSAAAKKKPASRKQPLATVSASEQNIKRAAPAAPSLKPPKITLQVVAEDPNEDVMSPVKKSLPPVADIPAPVEAVEEEQQQQQQQPIIRKQKTRKSLATFAAFTAEPAPETRKAKTGSKARKLGGLGKTLFDEEDDGAAPSGATAALSKGGLFGGAKGKLGPLGGLARGSSAFFGGIKGKAAAAQRTEDGFTFSPLKKDRKAAGMSLLK